MIELTGTLKSLDFDYITRKAKVTIEVNEENAIKTAFDGLQDKVLSIQIKQYRPKRSIDANAYCWKLCTEIANVLRTDKDSVYLTMLKRYGQSDIVSVLADVNVNGYFKYFDEFGEGQTNGKSFKHYKVYKGSSEYDTREMSILIDGIKSEAQEMGIDTRTPDEIADMLSRWGEQ